VAVVSLALAQEKLEAAAKKWGPAGWCQKADGSVRVFGRGRRFLEGGRPPFVAAKWLAPRRRTAAPAPWHASRRLAKSLALARAGRQPLVAGQSLMSAAGKIAGRPLVMRVTMPSWPMVTVRRSAVPMETPP
jgi:hypothetical protein